MSSPIQNLERALETNRKILEKLQATKYTRKLSIKRQAAWVAQLEQGIKVLNEGGNEESLIAISHSVRAVAFPAPPVPLSFWKAR